MCILHSVNEWRKHPMKKLKSLLALVLALSMALALTACGTAPAKPDGEAGSGGRTEPLVISFGSCAADTDMLSLIAYKFAELLDERSGGMLQIDYYGGSKLGNETEMLDQILTGSLDMGCISVNVCSQVWPDLGVFSLPFAFDDEQMFWDVSYDEDFLAATKNVYESTGDVVYVGPYFVGFRHIQNSKHAIRQLSDFSDLTFRVMAGQIYTDTYNALGAATDAISFDELYTALQQHVVDGEDCTVFTAYLQGFFDVEKYETQLNMTAASNPLIIARSTWEKMTEDEQALFMECYQDAEQYGIPQSAAYVDEYTQKAIDEIVEINTKVALSLNIVGLMNLQLAYKDGEIWMIEANPRASRTVPFISKATGVPLAKIGVKVMLGRKLKEFGLKGYRAIDHYAIKASVFPFLKLPGVDSILTPEMKSTGEVMGIDADFDTAAYKAFAAAGNELPTSGGVYFTVNDHDKPAALEIAKELVQMGFKIYATKGTSTYFREHGVENTACFKNDENMKPNAIGLMRDGDINLVINTPSQHSGAVRDGHRMRRLAVELEIPFITTINGAKVAVGAIKVGRKNEIGVKSMQEFHGLV